MSNFPKPRCLQAAIAVEQESSLENPDVNDFQVWMRVLFRRRQWTSGSKATPE
jgi:hypothetical protein